MDISEENRMYHKLNLLLRKNSEHNQGGAVPYAKPWIGEFVVTFSVSDTS